MKSLVCFTIATLFHAGTVVSQEFEGAIVFKMVGGDESQNFEYLTKGHQIRMEFESTPGEEMAVIINAKTGTAFMIMPGSRMYMEMNLNEMPGDETDDEQVDFRKTGKTETILGYRCEQVFIKAGDIEAELWVTKGLGNFVQSTFNAGSKSPAMKRIEDELMSEGFFPLRLISRTSDGREEFRMDVLSVVRKKLGSELFVVPSGFKKIEMPQRP